MIAVDDARDFARRAVHRLAAHGRDHHHFGQASDAEHEVGRDAAVRRQLEAGLLGLAKAGELGCHRIRAHCEIRHDKHAFVVRHLRPRDPGVHVLHGDGHAGQHAARRIANRPRNLAGVGLCGCGGRRKENEQET